MFKPKLWQIHNEYRTIVTTVGRRLSRNNPKYSFDIYEEERLKLLNLNPDPLTGYIPDFYSQGERPAKHQAQILRHLILFVLLYNKTKARVSLTPWVRNVLPNSISLTLIIGCPSTDELPPLGSYYDFMGLFWLAPGISIPGLPFFPPVKTAKNRKSDRYRWQTPRTGPPSSVTTKDIMDGNPASENP